MRALLDATVEALYARTGRWIEHDSDEMLLASSPELTIYHIALSPRIHYPPHDHRVPAIIGLYQGAETSFSYQRDGRALLRGKRHDYAATWDADLREERRFDNGFYFEQARRF
jgi:predicted metal-dependent enzyme (double-stranded beta helix superfamily)